MSTTVVPGRFTTLPDEHALQASVVALEEHGFSVEVVGDLDAARQAVLARIPEGASVMTNASVTLSETGITDAINDAGGRWESARYKMFALDFASQALEMNAIGGQLDYALGSVHAVTRDGTLVIASASGSQLASYAWGAANVIFVVGAQKLGPPWKPRTSGSISTACRWRTPAHRRPTDSTARSGRSSRSIRNCPAASTSSSSASGSASKPPSAP
jgi:acyl-CoA hydrolase